MRSLRTGLIAVICTTALGVGCDAGQIGGNQLGGDGGGANSDGTNGQSAAGVESCNGFDDDGDGLVDEGCPCTVGDEQPCFPGTADQLQGACAEGTQRCEGGDEFAGWGPCEGAVTPRPEICGDGVDQDCDGDDEACDPGGAETPADAVDLPEPTPGCPPANKLYTVTIDKAEKNVVLRAKVDGLGYDGSFPVDVVCEIVAGAELGSTAAELPSFDTGMFPQCSRIAVVNRGMISGKGGTGGTGGRGAHNGGSGGPGGSAFKATYPCSLDNLGVIRGGGGGGGGGGAGGSCQWNCCKGASGGGGGQGHEGGLAGPPVNAFNGCQIHHYAGTSGSYVGPGTGGAKTDCGGGKGGKGGTWGQDGEPGVKGNCNCPGCGGTGLGLPGDGGRGGYSVEGDPLVTWKTEGQLVGQRGP